LRYGGKCISSEKRICYFNDLPNLKETKKLIKLEMNKTKEVIVRCKGDMHHSEIPPDVLRALNEGIGETITLAEWLAIDMPTLLRSILPGVEFAEATEQLGKFADGLAGEGVTVRLKKIGEAFFHATRNHPRRTFIYEALGSHRSDMV